MSIHEIVLALSLVVFFGDALVSKKRDFVWISSIGIISTFWFKFLGWTGTLQFFGDLIEVIIVSAMLSYLYRSFLIFVLL